MHNDIRQVTILPASIRVLLFTSVVVRCREQLSIRPHLVFFVLCGAFMFKFKMRKRKHTLLTIKQKNELLDKLEKGVPVVNLVAEYGVTKQTISAIRRNKEKICAYADQVRSEQGVSDPNYSRKKLTTGHFVELEQAVS